MMTRNELPCTCRKLANPPNNPVLFLLLISSSLLSGCGSNDIVDLKKYIEEVKARPKSAIEKLPEINMVDPFVFPVDTLRDPFKPLEEPETYQGGGMTVGNGLKPDFTRRKEELEAFPLDGLKMAGTIVMKSKLWGLVKASDKTIHRVQVGNYMGKNFGEIIRISTEKIELLEIVPDKPGTWREQQSYLALTQ
ncbi:MAG: pilus assembly protein PilP [Methylovulum sp.]|uniref:pilus assembly protein PilP n=1 Tax=Methylovulum sp. TaxID=1916980 RepID=UPI00261C693B|nr:pilus assembly protein PilP [Methylovulum sp.]MDD2723096.1 pilus assembly protein PilP [Methylovulum sp.]MDD5123562.1 pilus assembly protein PilP [Methylovulum sp.]